MMSVIKRFAAWGVVVAGVTGIYVVPMVSAATPALLQLDNDELLFRITRLGTKALVGGDHETDMHGFGNELTDRQIIAVLSCIKSTWPENIKKRHDAMNKRK